MSLKAMKSVNVTRISKISPIISSLRDLQQNIGIYEISLISVLQIKFSLNELYTINDAR